MDPLQQERARLVAAALARLGRARTRELPASATPRVRFELELAMAGVHGAVWIGSAENTKSLVNARTWFEASVRQCAKQLAEAETEDARASAEFELALAYDNFGDLEVAAHQLDAAYLQFERAVGLWRSLAQAAPRSELLGNRLLRAYDKVAHSAMCAERFEDARGWLEHALDVLHAAASAAPRVRTQHALLQVFLELGSVAVLTSQRAEAAGWFDSAIEVARAMCAREPDHGWWRHHLCVALVGRAGVSGAAPWLDEARALLAHDVDARDVILAEERAQLAARIEALG